MKEKIYILILALTLISCQTDNKLTGNWIGDYAYSINDNETRIIKPIRRILTCNNGICSAKGSKYDYGTEIQKGKYNLILKTLELDGEYEDYEIETIEKDSLVLIKKSNSFRYIYRKLPENLKHESEIEFIGKKFKWVNNEFTDTIFFKDEFFLKRKSTKISWERIKHNGFDIIFLDLDVPYVVESQHGKTVNLKTFHKNVIEHAMTELE